MDPNATAGSPMGSPMGVFPSSPLNGGQLAPSARVPVRVKYLLSSQWSASATVVHFFCVEVRRGTYSVPIQRVVAVSDARGYDLDIDAAMQRCVDFSRIEGFMMLPRDIEVLEGKRSTPLPNNTLQSTSLSTLGNPGAMQAQQPAGYNGGITTGGTFLDDPYGNSSSLTDAATILPSGASNPNGQNDFDLFLQQSDANDFLRTAGALYKPNLSGGSPPLLQLEEGQPLGGNKALVRLREQPLRTAIVDGVSSDALKAICEEQNKQIRVLKERWNKDKMLNTNDQAEMFSQRDALRTRVTELERQLVGQESGARNERDRMRLQVAQLQEDLHRAREEIKMLKLMKGGSGISSSTNMPGTPLAGAATNTSFHTPGPASSGIIAQQLATAGGGTPASHQGGGASPALQQLHSDIQESEQFLTNLRSSSNMSAGGSSGSHLYSNMSSAQAHHNNNRTGNNNVSANLSVPYQPIGGVAGNSGGGPGLRPSNSPSPAQPRQYNF